MNTKRKLIYPELSYRIIGILFKVHSQLGSQYQEKYYQRAVELALKEMGLQYQKEISVDIQFNNNRIGKYLLDFVIEDKIVLELKAKGQFCQEDIRQVLGYLKAKNLRLGILANFRKDRLEYKRIINREYSPE